MTSTPKSLTDLGATTAAPVDAKPPTTSPYDPTRDREKIRGQVALTLTWSLVSILGAMTLAGVITVFYCLGHGECTDTTLELKGIGSLATIVPTPLVGLVGAVTGFYFGEKAARASERA